jgi:hypothetical protein
VHRAPDDDQLRQLNTTFGHLALTGTIDVVGPYKAEIKDDDVVDLDRISFTFSKRGYGSLMKMIRTLNSYVD